jgi:hypothetical protein
LTLREEDPFFPERFFLPAGAVAFVENVLYICYDLLSWILTGFVTSFESYPE